MSFVDRVVVEVHGGRGGDGVASFARFKFKAKGGPDGGDGGHGGSVYLSGDSNLSTLLDYRYHPIWKAERGQHGKGSNQTGASGDDVRLPVPPGTEARDAESGELLGEILTAGDEIRLARGGRGGRGNAGRATSTQRAPRESDDGGSGEYKRIELTLKMIADVGLVGEPNAGKSTLLSVISAARPKVANYPFTTLSPNLGVVSLSPGRTMVVADIPGIIEGAHQGKGLGLEFLRHIERTRVLAYLVPADEADPAAVLERLRNELRLHSEELVAKPSILVFSKADLIGPDDSLDRSIGSGFDGTVVISAAARTGLEEFNTIVWDAVAHSRKLDHPGAEQRPDRPHPDDHDWNPSEGGGNPEHG